MTPIELREMDVQIAERIGWTKIRQERYEDRGSVHTGEWYGLSPQGMIERVPHFTSDVSAAWGLIERIRLHLKPPAALLILAGASQIRMHYGGIAVSKDNFPAAAAELFCRVSEREDLTVHPSLRPFLGSVDPEEARGIVTFAEKSQ